MILIKINLLEGHYKLLTVLNYEADLKQHYVIITIIT